MVGWQSIKHLARNPKSLSLSPQVLSQNIMLLASPANASAFIFSLSIPDQLMPGNCLTWLNNALSWCHAHKFDITCSWNICIKGRPSHAPQLSSNCFNLWHFSKLNAPVELSPIHLHLSNHTYCLASVRHEILQSLKLTCTHNQALPTTHRGFMLIQR